MSADHRTYLLTFVGARGFLGAAVIDVSEQDVLAIARSLASADDGHWSAAACRRAWDAGCHPGGEVALAPLRPEQATVDLGVIPRCRLLSIHDLVRVGLIREH